MTHECLTWGYLVREGFAWLIAFVALGYYAVQRGRKNHVLSWALLVGYSLYIPWLVMSEWWKP